MIRNQGQWVPGSGSCGLPVPKILTTSGTLPGVGLPARSYTFDVASDTALDVVVVRNRTKVFYMGFTGTVQRPASMSKTAAITLGEASASEAPPITAWYEIGGTIGHAFRY